MEEKFPEVVGNSHYEKLWNQLDRRELRDFGSTKKIQCVNQVIEIPDSFVINDVFCHLFNLFLFLRFIFLFIIVGVINDSVTWLLVNLALTKNKSLV